MHKLCDISVLQNGQNTTERTPQQLFVLRWTLFSHCNSRGKSLEHYSVATIGKGSS
jgi:hypothetical protein